MEAKVTAKLWKHQELMVDFAEYQLRNRGYAYWLAGCTVGKTIAALSLITRFQFRRTLVICTKAAIPSAWLEDIKTHTEGFTLIPLLKGTSATKAERMLTALKETTSPAVVAVNYETARLIAPQLKQAGFDFVIADESHKLASPTSKVSVSLAEVALGIPYRLAMTGTGWDDRPTQLFGQVRFLAPTKGRRTMDSELFGNWYKFFETYVVYYSYQNVKIPKGYKNLPRLRETIEPFTMDILTEDVIELPEEIHVKRYVDPTPELKAAYVDMQRDMVAQFGDDLMRTTNVLAQSLRLHQLAGGFYTPYVLDELGRPVANGGIKEVPGAKPKLEALLDIMDEIGGKPVVIFTRFTDDVRVIQAALTEAGISTKVLVGGCHEHIEWQAGEGQVLIANIQAGSAGVNLNRARYCIYYSIGYSRTDYNQSRYRVRRKGSDITKPITYFHILMRGTIDEEILAGMSSKEHIANELRKGLQRVV